MEDEVLLHTDRASRTAAEEEPACHPQPWQGPLVWGVVRAPHSSSSPKGFSGADKATLLLKLKQTQTDKQRSRQVELVGATLNHEHSNLM